MIPGHAVGALGQQRPGTSDIIDMIDRTSHLGQRCCIGHDQVARCIDNVLIFAQHQRLAVSQSRKSGPAV